MSLLNCACMSTTRSGGSEFGIEGKKERYSDDSLRPALRYEDYANAAETNALTRLIAALGKVRHQVKALSYGDYRELTLTNRQYAFARGTGDETVLVTVNNDDNGTSLTLPAFDNSAYVGALSGVQVTAGGGNITVNLPGCSGEIWLPVREGMEHVVAFEQSVEPSSNQAAADAVTPDDNADADVTTSDSNASADAATPNNNTDAGAATPNAAAGKPPRAMLPPEINTADLFCVKPLKGEGKCTVI